MLDTCRHRWTFAIRPDCVGAWCHCGNRVEIAERANGQQRWQWEREALPTSTAELHDAARSLSEQLRAVLRASERPSKN